MSLLRHMNVSVGEVIFETAVSYSFSELVPPFMLESVMFGVVSIASLLAIYSLLAIKRHDGRPWKLAIGVALVFAICATHWGLQFRSMKSILSGSGLGVPLDELLLESGPLPELDQLVLVGETLVLEVFLPLVTETVLFGVATFLVLVAVYFMLQRTGRLNFVSFSLRLALFLMFAIALTHWSTVLVFWTTLSRGRGSFTPYNNRLLLTLFECWAELLAFNIALSDAIVLWRMCVLWRRQRYLIEISIVLVLATFAMSIANVTTSVRSVRQSGAKYTDINFMVSALPILGKASHFWIAELCLSWTTNVFATGMIAIKAWWHRNEISAHIRDGTRTTMAEKVMALLVESGSIYSCVWTAYLVTSLALENSSSVTTLDYWDLAMAQITLIYPTTIIILVTIEKTHCDTEFTYGSSNAISFANASSLTATSTPRHHRIELAGPQRFELVASRGRVTVLDIAPPACEDGSGAGVKTGSRSSSDREDLEKEFPDGSEPVVGRKEKLDKAATPSRNTFDMDKRPSEREGVELSGAAV